MRHALLICRRWMRLVPIALGAALTLLVVFNLTNSQADTADLGKLLDQYRATSQPAAKDAKPAESPDSAQNSATASPQQQQVQRIAKRHPFARETQPPPIKLTGVLGDKAYFEGSPEGLAVGQEFQGAKIKEIGADSVVVERGGVRQTQYVWAGQPSGPSEGGRPGGMMIPQPLPSPSPMARPMPSAARPQRPSASSGMDIPPEAIEYFKSLSPQQREKALQSAPPEIREQLLKAM